VDSSEFERLLLAHLDHVNRVVRLTGRRYGLSATDIEDCSSWVALRLVEHDYRLLRKFRQESSLKTFLTVVVVKLVRDYCTQLRGRWRPSATAKRLGPFAVRLETLVYRDGLAYDQACEVIRQDPEAPTAKDLAKLFAKIPPRSPVRPRDVDESASSEVQSSHEAQDSVEAHERESEYAKIQRAVDEVKAELTAQERTILRLLYEEGLSVADVARALRVPQKPLYRQIARLAERIRKRLEALGVSRERIQGLLDDAD
jgi:RNA polymerase sigma factor (sigma-70 family)